MIGRINAQRAAHGLKPLRENRQLGEAALGHALDMARNPGIIESGNYHVGSDGSSILDRIRRQGYTPTRWGEVTGWGFDGETDRMVQWWLDSPAHRAQLLSADFEDIGVGYVYAPGTAWGHYWVVNFGKRAGAPPPVYTSHIPIAMSGAGAVELDLLPYLRGDGRTYRVGNARGTYELFQTQADGSAFYQIKSWDDQSFVPWEGFTFDDEYIRRDVDCSPGGGRFYRQFNAPWVRRRMAIGQTFTQGKRIQFYRLENCVPLEQYSGDVIDTIKLVAHYRQYTFPARDWPAVTLDDVIELEWTQGGEVYHYARGYGLVGWSRRHQDVHSPAWSAISEMRPDVGHIERMGIDCL